MRRFFVPSITLAACLIAATALAASDRLTKDFEAVGPFGTGVSGQATINPMPDGSTQIHEQLRGLEPGAQYVSVVYQQGSTCATGGPTTEVERFVANPAGIANFNKKIALELNQIGSISVQRVTDNAVVACAAVQ